MTDIAINPVTRRVQFQGTTGTGPFAFSFNILQASDIAVLKNNVVLAIGTGATNYSVSINANGTGSVSLVTALISSDTLIIMGGRELSRTTDFVTAGDLLASSLNEQLDSNVVMSQQLDEKVDRSIIAQPGDKLVGINLSLPLVADRANELIKFDASGNVTTIPVTEIVGTDIDTQKVTIKTSAGATKLVINGNITDLITAADNLTIVSTSGDIDFKPGGGQINLLASTGAQRMALDNAAQPTMQYFQASNVTKLGVVDPTATRTLLLPDASDTLVGKATTDTLTNKTLASPVITGSLGVGTLTGSGDILLDAAGDIVLDAAGDQIFFKDGGTLRITFEIGAAGTSMVSASELVMAVTSGGINFKPQTGNVDFLTNSGGQALQINAIGSSTITYYQNSNTTKLGVVNPTGSRVLLLPDASDTLVGKATTDTLTNKTLANPAFTGNLNFTGDVAIDASGDITLDADGGEIYFKDGGATRLTFQVSAVAAQLNSASDFNVNSAGDIALQPAGGQVDILGTSGEQRIQFDNSAQATMKYYQNSNTTTLGVVDPTGTRALLLPDASDTLVGKATTDTLTNKTLTSPTITGSLDMSDVNITNVGSIALDRITNDGSGGITLDSSQGINYDAGTGQNLFKVNGQTRLTVALNSSAIQTITSLATLSITAGNDINLRPNGGQLYVLNNAGGDNFQFNTSSTPTLGIHQNSNVTNLGLVSPTATRNILFPDASDTLVGKATTDTLTNKTLTSPVINTGVSGSAFLDEDNFASNSATKIASQQSIKAYVDAATAGGGAGSLSTVLGIGNTTGSNNVLFGDNNKAIFGAGSDLEIYSDGTHGIINSPASLFINIDSDNGATGEDFVIAKDRTSTSGGTELFRVQEDGNVGIGTTSNLLSGSNRTTVSINNTDSAAIAFGVGGTREGFIYSDASAMEISSASNLMKFTAGDSERMRLDSAGTLFLNTTSPTLHSSVTGIVLDNGSLLNDTARGAGKSLTLAQNLAIDSGNTFAYLATDEGSYYQQFGGSHFFATTPSGSAGADATLTNRFVISNDGSISTPTAGAHNVRFGVNAGNSIVSGGNENVCIGDEAGTAIDTGYGNVALGYRALFTNTHGRHVVAIGPQALDVANPSSASSTYNVAVGYAAGLAMNTGAQNTIVGGLVARNLTNASDCAMFGTFAGYHATSSNNSTFLGSHAGYGVDATKLTGNNNTAVGYAAGYKLQGAATNNTLVGTGCGEALTVGNDNTAVGRDALTADTKGGSSVAIGDGALSTQNFTSATDVFNVAVGRLAGEANVSGASCTFIGGLAGRNSTGGSNTALGAAALDAAVSGSQNTAVGVNALGAANGAANNNTAVGVQAGASVTTGDNNLLLGFDAGQTGSPGGAQTTGSDSIALGDENIGNAYIQVDWTIASDARDKTDFTALDLGLDFVKAMKPYTFKWDKRSKYGDKTADGYDLDAATSDGTHKEDWLDLGFKAQDVKALEEASNYKIADKTNLTVSITDDGKQYGMKYAKLVPILVKAIQEQSALIEALTARVATLEG